MQAPPATQHLFVGEREGEVGRERGSGDVLGDRHHERGRFERDVAHGSQPSVTVVGGRSQPDLRTSLVDGPPSQRHAVLPADEPAHPRAARDLDHAEVVARAGTVEHALVHRRDELAMPVPQTLGTQDQQRVVERARAVVLALVDADGEVDTVLGARLDQLLDVDAADVDARGPEAFPELVASGRPRRRRGRPPARGVDRHEALGEHDERGPLGRGGRHELASLLNGAVGIEDGRCRLHRGHPHSFESGHGAR